jgi:hypothetical protein
MGLATLLAQTLLAASLVHITSLTRANDKSAALSVVNVSSLEFQKGHF